MIVLNSLKRRVEIQEIGRDEFVDTRWSYRAGQHVTAVGPTDWGKTTLMYQLIEKSAHKDLPAISLVMKPEDETVDLWVPGLGHDIIRSWPPPFRPWKSRPPGYAVWPKHTFDADTDDAHLYWEFKRCISQVYGKRIGSRKIRGAILFSDEVAGLARLWNLDRQLDNVWERGRTQRVGLWGASQRPYNVPQNAYGMASHLFLGNDPDERSRKRYAEIGGMDLKLVQNATGELDDHMWLYLRRKPRAICIVGA
ncbi:MAG: hypothetical protein V4515_14795 [Chloroflexota bacterium]